MPILAMPPAEGYTGNLSTLWCHPCEVHWNEYELGTICFLCGVDRNPPRNYQDRPHESSQP